jgi:hypothetical protein
MTVARRSHLPTCGRARCPSSSTVSGLRCLGTRLETSLRMAAALWCLTADAAEPISALSIQAVTEGRRSWASRCAIRPNVFAAAARSRVRNTRRSASPGVFPDANATQRHAPPRTQPTLRSLVFGNPLRNSDADTPVTVRPVRPGLFMIDRDGHAAVVLRKTLRTAHPYSVTDVRIAFPRTPTINRWRVSEQ